MKTHEITTSKGEFVVVDRKDDLPILTFISNMYDLGLRKYICKLSEATEDDAKDVVDSRLKGGGLLSYPKIECYKDYLNGGYTRGGTALLSLKCLLKSKGIDINNGNWYLFKNI